MELQWYVLNPLVYSVFDNLYIYCFFTLKLTAGGAQGATRAGSTGNARTGATGGLGGLGSADLSSLFGGLAGNTGTGATGGLGGLGSADLGSLLGGSPDSSSLSQILQNPVMMQMMQNIMSDPQSMNQVRYFLTYFVI